MDTVESGIGLSLLTDHKGTEDAPYGVTVPAEQIKLFTASKEATLDFIEGGGHYLNATNPKEIGDALLKMVKRYS